ncbi:MBL fold metallo-hydrolase [Pedobacter duraquae]|uniref:Putative mRNA 3-end processing factor n=1 Tax=Pedobacter duraquae TaxID=425511 RepID=A0A4R6IS20_9SPHI|nr:MBL fold metallo-hydrolase [Pedobacter duraquae]TDO24756.1 putative mRNA 3-end processing factor [Pedobacter duraquae]
MILDDFIVPGPAGLYCVYGDFYLDPKIPVKHAVISHAHGDHAISGNQDVYCTKPTSLFMLHRYKKFAASEFHIKEYGESFNLKSVKISFISAGHMAGSAQVVMEYLGVRYIYSGDYKLQTDPTSEPIQFMEADVFITETTFADPDTRHPDAETEITNLSKITSNIMLGAYALGKSQRIVRLISDHCPEKRILVHHSIMPFMKIYEQLGISLGKYEVYDRKVMKNNHSGMVYIVPPMVYRSYIKAINVVRVFASGWKHLNNNRELSLCISDHVDWNDIITAIEQVKPKEVWTNHGSGTELKAHFNEKLVVKLLN